MMVFDRSKALALCFLCIGVVCATAAGAQDDGDTDDEDEWIREMIDNATMFIVGYFVEMCSENEKCDFVLRLFFVVLVALIVLVFILKGECLLEFNSRSVKRAAFVYAGNKTRQRLKVA